MVGALDPAFANVKTIDSSIAVAAFGEWHELNASARRVLDGGAALPAHALFET